MNEGLGELRVSKTLFYYLKLKSDRSVVEIDGRKSEKDDAKIRKEVDEKSSKAGCKWFAISFVPDFKFLFIRILYT